MSRLDVLLVEEYERLGNKKMQFLKEIDVLPIGHIVFKKSEEKTYVYLQRFERGNLISEPIAPEDLLNVQMRIQQRNNIKKAIKEIEFDQKRIAKILSAEEKQRISII